MKKRLLATVLAAVMIISGTQIAGATSLSQARSQKEIRRRTNLIL